MAEQAFDLLVATSEGRRIAAPLIAARAIEQATESPNEPSPLLRAATSGLDSAGGAIFNATVGKPKSPLWKINGMSLAALETISERLAENPDLHATAIVRAVTKTDMNVVWDRNLLCISLHLPNNQELSVAVASVAK